MQVCKWAQTGTAHAQMAITNKSKGYLRPKRLHSPIEECSALVCRLLLYGLVFFMLCLLSWNLWNRHSSLELWRFTFHSKHQLSTCMAKLAIIPDMLHEFRIKDNARLTSSICPILWYFTTFGLLLTFSYGCSLVRFRLQNYLAGFREKIMLKAKLSPISNRAFIWDWIWVKPSCKVLRRKRHF